MLQIRKFKVCIKITDNGKECTNPSIVLGKNKDLLKNCEIDKDGCITFSVLEDEFSSLQGKCVPYTIICQDCGDCPAKDGEICFCDRNEDCDSCSNCIGGICKPKCADKCVDGDCVECTGNDCPTNQECIDGKCKCPKHKPYLGEDGVCRECRDKGDCKACEFCNEGDCKPLDCGTGQCDPRLDKCVDCVDASACGPNEICENNKCVCAPGYTYNPITKKCEPKPECTDNDDCGACEYCNKGECKKVECPDNFICDPKLDDCVYSPCPPTPCKDGTDCGPECGCDKVCTECAKLSCADCSKALGCKCNELTGVCEKVKNCDNPCTNKYDCDTNCGCDDGTCKDCSNYSCEECAKISGCKCTNGKCEDDGTKDGCPDTFKLEATYCPKGELTATLTKDVTCNCNPIDIAFTPPTGNNSTAKVIVKKVVGSALVGFSDSTSPFISDNEKEVTASYKVSLRGSYRRSTDSQIIPFGPIDITRSVNNYTGEFILDGTFGVTLPDFGELTTSIITYTHTSTDFTENKCEYKNKEVYSNSDVRNFTYNGSLSTITFSVNGATSNNIRITSETKRSPLFVWYKNSEASFSNSNIIKRKYIDSSTATYTDKITFADNKLFDSGYSYKVTNDCSCEKEALYIWDCNKEKFFDPANLIPEVTECGRKITVAKIPACSDMHKDLNYEVIINGTKEGEGNGNSGGTITKSYPTGVESLQLKVTTKNSKVCLKDFPIEKETPPEVEIDTVCLGESTKVLIPAEGIESVKAGVNTYPKVGNNFEAVILNETTFIIKFINGCDAEIKVVPKSNCCDEVKFTFLNDSTEHIISYVDGAKGLNQSIGLIVPQGFTITSSSAFVTTNTVGSNTFANVVIPSSNTLTNSSYTLTATKDTCTKSVTIKLEKSSIKLSINSTKGCSNPTLKIERVGANNGPVTFEVTSNCGVNTWTGTLNGQETTNLVNQLTTNCTYTLTKVGGVSITPQSVSYEKLNSVPSLSISQVNTTGIENCTNDYITVNITPSTNYNLKDFVIAYTINSVNYTGVVQVTSGGQHFIRIPLTQFTCNSINDSITFTNISLADCQSTINSVLTPANIPCKIAVTDSKECIGNLSYIKFTGIPANSQLPVYVTPNGSNNQYQLQLVSGEWTFGRYNFENIANVTSGYTLSISGYCPINFPAFTPNQCLKNTLKVNGEATACFDGTDLNFISSTLNLTGFVNGDTLEDISADIAVKLVKNCNNVITEQVLTENTEYTINGNNIVLDSFAYTYQTGCSYSIVVSHTNANSIYNVNLDTPIRPLTINQVANITEANAGIFVLVKYENNTWVEANSIVNGQPFYLGGDTTINIPNQEAGSTLKLIPVTLLGGNNYTYSISVNGGAAQTISSVQAYQPVNYFAQGVSISSTGQTVLTISRTIAGACESNEIELTFVSNVSVGDHLLFESCTPTNNPIYNTFTAPIGEYGLTGSEVGSVFRFFVAGVETSCYTLVGFSQTLPTFATLLGSYSTCEECDPPPTNCGPCGVFNNFTQSCQPNDSACGSFANCNYCDSTQEYYCSDSGYNCPII